MKFYLSGPMTGYPQFNVPAFEAASEWLRKVGHEVVSPHEMDKDDGIGDVVKTSPNGDVAALTVATGETWGTLLARDVRVIADGNFDAIFVLPGWLQSKGARLEVFVFLLKKLPVIEYETGIPLPLPVVLELLNMSFLEAI